MSSKIWLPTVWQRSWDSCLVPYTLKSSWIFFSISKRAFGSCWILNKYSLLFRSRIKQKELLFRTDTPLPPILWLRKERAADIHQCQTCRNVIHMGIDIGTGMERKCNVSQTLSQGSATYICIILIREMQPKKLFSIQQMEWLLWKILCFRGRHY